MKLWPLLLKRQGLITLVLVRPARKEAEANVEEEDGDVNHSSINSCHLQPELYGQAAQTYCRAGYCMGEPFHKTKPDEIHSCTDEKNHADHRCNCHCSEYACHNNYAEPTTPGSRIHKGGNQNLARPENKNNKQRPWCNAYPAVVIVNVNVLLVVTMLVRVA